ncbi:MAG: aspartate aminotransferase family protein [Armatimonadetes bacterium]|nr:aspartate aminotransferase family protein [Armatimonadota bacterium]MDW8121311.1 aspartate aminotransferase family protein [Armatimonadota bacterium]
MNFEEIQRLTQEGLTPNYSRYPVAFIRGIGARLWDVNGKEYLDFLAGIAVCGAGHCHPRLVAALQQQADMLWHTSNLFYIGPQAVLGKRLGDLAGGYQCFFCNSGAEAIEASLKLARKIGKTVLGGKWQIIACEESFHGRTFGALSVTGQPKYHFGFEPLLPGVRFVPYGDLPSLENAITDETCAVIVEPIQGESGVKIPDDGFLPGIARLAKERSFLLIVDEVQTGLGRTGKLFAFQHYQVEPDIIALAKTLAGGFPMGAMLAKPQWAEHLTAGSHASTFGGNFLASAVALAFLDVLEEEKLPERATEMGDRLQQGLKRIVGEQGEIRGKGLMVAAEFSEPIAPALRDACLSAEPTGLIVNAIGDRILRFVPPLIVSEEDVDEALEIFARCWSAVRAKKQ